MSQNYWLIILFVATMVCNEAFSRPREVDLTNIRPVYRTMKEVEREPPNRFVGGGRPDVENLGSGQDSKLNIEAIATLARASSGGQPASSSAVIDHIVDTVSQMVVSDMRTPPKLREIIKDENTGRRGVLGEGLRPMPVTFVYEDDEKPEKTSFSGTEKFLQTDTSVGKASAAVNSKIVVHEVGTKGVAIPVVMDETEETTEPIQKLQKISEFVKPVKDERKKPGITKVQVTTTPSSGLSTWILLSDNRDPTTPAPKRVNNKKDGSAEEKKKTTAGTTATTKKAPKVQSTTVKTVTVKKATVKPVSSGTRKPEIESATSVLEALVKTQKKVLATTTSKPRTTESKAGGSKRPQTDSKKKLTGKIDVLGANDRIDVTVPDTKTVYTIPTHFALTTEDPTSLSINTEKNSASSVTETTTENPNKKKKTSAKKKKKNKKKKKTETGVEPKIPSQPVGSQIYNFLSREIVPTVGLGLIGVALTAGLASFLGYNPFVSTAVPLRRTYETSHGYSPSNYYTYNSDYGDGGQSEEVLLREVLSGMPEESRYELTHGDTSYSDMYNRNDQYDRMKNTGYSTQTGNTYNTDKETVNYNTTYYSTSSNGNYDLSDKKYTTDYDEKYPVYTRETGTSFVYPETPAMMPDMKSTRQGSDSSIQQNKNEKYTKTKSDTIERQPEALYRVSNEGDHQYRNGDSTIQGIGSQSNWHRMGTPMEPVKEYSRVEPGPRSLDLNKESSSSPEKKRTKRNASDNIQRIARKRTTKETDAENEIDFEDDNNKSDDEFPAFSLSGETTTETEVTATTATTTSPTSSTSMESTESSTNIVGKDENTDSSTEEDSSVPFPIDDDTGTETLSSTNASFLDILKRLAQFKLRLGLNFLRSTTDMFSRYLDVIQRKVDESFTNTTTVQYNRRKSPWSRIFFGGSQDNSLRTKRSALQENPFLTSLLAEESRFADRYSKSTKKELKTSGKMIFAKKSVPKKYRAEDEPAKM